MDFLLLTIIMQLCRCASRCRLFDNATILRNVIERGTQVVSLSGQLANLVNGEMKARNKMILVMD
jgi:hypothetical protein